ncbi:hemerythrin domain-containing protein [uncultured Draconibacterium sp.]|uniref:hemerythrin domain-containing protein n=1 Tax=uncultured Draconibacterium sp. TaxID=1573823 RepID=UPI0025DE6635|nr:hemerythrin domain-containing protein [uncultured Draconibacterium sp.]
MSLKHEKIGYGIKVSKLLFTYPQLILVLERFGIKLGVHEKTVEELCAEYQISTKVFLMVANLNIDSSYNYQLEFDVNEVKQIVQYLMQSHTYYADEVFPEIIQNIHLMSEDSQKPEMQLVERFFNEYKNEVDQHFDYENNTVFPYILNLLEASAKNNYSVIDYREHHDDIQEKLDDVKRLLIEHLPQKSNSKLRRKILFALFDLDADLQIHSKIENEILIPQVEQLEKQNLA